MSKGCTNNQKNMWGFPPQFFYCQGLFTTTQYSLPFVFFSFSFCYTNTQTYLFKSGLLSKGVSCDVEKIPVSIELLQESPFTKKKVMHLNLHRKEK